MKSSSLGLRSRVAAVCRGPGTSKAAVAQRFNENHSFLKDLVRHEAATGSLAPKPATSGWTRYVNGVLTKRRFACKVAPMLRRGDVLVLDNLPHRTFAHRNRSGRKPNLPLRLFTDLWPTTPFCK